MRVRATASLESATKYSRKMTSGHMFSGSITPIVTLTEDSSNLEYSSRFKSFNNKNKKDEFTTADKRSSSFFYCRICHEDSSIEELIDPCSCSGTLALIHTSCLEKWLSTSNTENCEICKHPFFIRRKNKSIFQSVSMWSRSKNVNGARGMMAVLISLLVLTPLCLAATYLCAIGASAYKSLGFWETTGLAVLCCTLIATYSLWFCATIRNYYRSLREWRENNQDVKLLVKHRTEVEKKTGISLIKKSKEQRLRDDDNDGRAMLAVMNPRQHRFASWFGANFDNISTDPVFRLHQTTFV